MADESTAGKNLKGMRRFWYLCRRDRDLLVIISLPFVFYVLFRYLPMYGIILAFKDFAVNKGILGSPWVGLRWFEQFRHGNSYFTALIDYPGGSGVVHLWVEWSGPPRVRAWR